MHRWSQLFIPTLREAPADAEVASHKFLLRAGYIRQLGAGIYSYLFLGQRSLNKIIAIVREEMDKIGQEFFLPAIQPRELWEESGRWTVMGDNMFRLKDRKGADLCLGMTHEEIMTTIARSELRSYKQLPQIWYQIQTKFRDEPRPKSGLLRVRQFIMKDTYSFDIDEAGLDESYDKHDEAYRSIFTRCGLKFVAVEADSGAMGGSQSQEFMVYTDAGEDLIASCPVCGYAANLEKATSRLAPVDEMEPTGDGMPELVHTPGQRRHRRCRRVLQDLAQPPTSSAWPTWRSKRGAKLASPTWPVVAFLRGDHQVNETKLLGASPARELRTMQAEELEPYFNGPAGYLGPVGLEAAPQPKPLGDGLPSSSTRRSKAARTWSPAPTSSTTTCATSPPAATSAWTLIADIRNVNEGEPARIERQARCKSSARPSRSATSSSSATSTPKSMGATRPRPQRQGSDAHHGQLRHRHRAHSHRRHRAVRRRQRGFWLALHPPSRPSRSSSPSPTSATRPSSPPAKRSPPTSKPPVSTSCSMTATSAPASNSRTPIWSASPIASISDAE